MEGKIDGMEGKQHKASSLSSVALTFEFVVLPNKTTGVIFVGVVLMIAVETVPKESCDWPRRSFLSLIYLLYLG